MNRSDVKSWHRRISLIPMGQNPSSLRASEKEALLLSTINHRTIKMLILLVNITVLILARIANGASLLNPGVGLVEESR